MNNYHNLSMEFSSSFAGAIAIFITNDAGTISIYQERGGLIPDMPWTKPKALVSVSNTLGANKEMLEAISSLSSVAAQIIDTVTYIWENTPSVEYKDELILSYGDIRSEFIPIKLFEED